MWLGSTICSTSLILIAVQPSRALFCLHRSASPTIRISPSAGNQQLILGHRGDNAASIYAWSFVLHLADQILTRYLTQGGGHIEIEEENPF